MNADSHTDGTRIVFVFFIRGNPCLSVISVSKALVFDTEQTLCAISVG